MIIAARTARKPAGNAVKPRTSARGEKGSRTPIATQVNVATARGVLGVLWKNGTRRVRMAKMIRLWIASDSTNQPDRNSAGPALNTQIMMPKVAKSKIELIGPKKVMKWR